MTSPKRHILVTGAAGAGTSTLGEALADRRGLRFLEADSCYWQPTLPPFTTKRPTAERNALLLQALQADASVVAGSVMGWGAEVENVFSLVIFLLVPTDVRLRRLEQRERQRFGRANPAFLEWAAQYDDGPPEGRSLQKHTAWLATRACPVLRLPGNHTVDELLSLIDEHHAHP